MLNAGENVGHSAIQGVVRRTPPYGQHGVTTEHALGKDALEWDTCKSFLLHLALDSVDGVAKECTTALYVSGMLIFASGVQLDSLSG